jgi:hypothetical protein
LGFTRAGPEDIRASQAGPASLGISIVNRGLCRRFPPANVILRLLEDEARRLVKKKAATSPAAFFIGTAAPNAVPGLPGKACVWRTSTGAADIPDLKKKLFSDSLHCCKIKIK